MSKTKIVALVATTIMLVGAGCSQTANIGASNSAPSNTPIKIGWVGPLTGDASSLGNDALKGAQLAVDEVNASGGVNGAPIQLVVEDGKCNSKDAALAGNKLINVDKVTVMETLCSGETVAIAPMAEQNKVVIVSNCSSAPGVTTAGDYIFRTFPSDIYQGKFAADYVYNKLGKHTVATMAILTDYGTGIQNSFETNFKQLGGRIVASEQFTQEARDLRTQLTKIKNSGAGLLYFAGYTETALAALKQAKELGLGLPIFSPDALDDSKVHASGLAEGLMYTVPAFKTDTGWNAKLVTRGGNMSSCTPRSYDNIKLLADVMGRVGTDATAVKDALYQVKDFPGVGGPISFDSNGDPTTATYDVKVVKNGKPELVK